MFIICVSVLLVFFTSLFSRQRRGGLRLGLPSLLGYRQDSVARRIFVLSLCRHHASTLILLGGLVGLGAGVSACGGRSLINRRCSRSFHNLRGARGCGLFRFKLLLACTFADGVAVAQGRSPLRDVRLLHWFSLCADFGAGFCGGSVPCAIGGFGLS